MLALQRTGIHVAVVSSLYGCEIVTCVCPLPKWRCVNALLHQSIYPPIHWWKYKPVVILSSVKSYFNLFFPFMLISKPDTQLQMYNPSQSLSTHTHTCIWCVSHSFSSLSDVLLSCSLDIGSIQLQSRLAANQRTTRRAAFASAHFSGRPLQSLGGAISCAGCAWKLKTAGEIHRQRKRHVTMITLASHEHFLRCFVFRIVDTDCVNYWCHDSDGIIIILSSIIITVIIFIR